jgi:hypothetical protein
MPLANKDGVARGRIRFNSAGKDLNRNWDKPADPQLAPENAALERWLEQMIKAGQKPDLALELHNDGSGQLHISRPPVAVENRSHDGFPLAPRQRGEGQGEGAGQLSPRFLENYLAHMQTLEALLRQHTWFTEGCTKATFRNPGSLGDGWLERFGIEAVVHEFNCHWIAGLKEMPTGRHWKNYGEKLVDVFAEYFVTVSANADAGGGTQTSPVR